ncbi:MAG TPA: hypothetical protein PK299_02980 [Anaerolineales bacterium]|nr:hypothetical protein [Anaerolineales bacterium]
MKFSLPSKNESANHHFTLLVGLVLLGLVGLVVIILLNLPDERPFLMFYLISLFALVGYSIASADNLLRQDLLALSSQFLAALGWNLLLVVLFHTRNSSGPLWLFFAAWMLAFTALALPLVRWMDSWFVRRGWLVQASSTAILLRRALIGGVYASICVWLSMRGTLNLLVAALLGIGLMVIAVFWELRERSMWKPQPLED